MKPLIDYDHVAKRVKKLIIIDCQPSAYVDQVVLLGAHPGAVCVIAEFFQNGGNGLVCISFLPLLNKEGVFDHSRRIQVDANSEAVAQFSQCPHIGHTHRLTARHIHSARQADVGNVFSPFLFDQKL